MLVLAWNEDYGDRGATSQPAAIAAPSADTIPDISDDGTVVAYDEIPLAAEMLPARTAPATTAVTTMDTSRFIEVKTDVFNIRIDRSGGDIEHVLLPAFPEHIDTPDVPFPLVDPRNNYAAQSGLVGPNGTDKPEGRPLFQTRQSVYELGNDNELTVDLTLPEVDGIKLVKRFTFFRGDYLINVDYLVENNSATPWTAALFGQIKRNGESPVFSDENGMGLKPYVGAATFQPGSPYTKLQFDDIEEERYQQNIEGGYIAMVQHYFLSAWIPEAGKTHTYTARKLNGQDVYLFEFTSPLQSVAPGDKGTIGAQFYAGPKDQYRLEQITPGLDLTVDYGFLWWLAQPLFDLLNLIHGVVNNWGVAIILLTVIVKTLLYPLSAASFRSMAKMRKLQPEMARLKERYGDDRQQFSQAMMELYKKEGANPLGGCFPVLLQMPVFLALYWTLLESVELRQAPFMLWIHDLSDMDPYFVLPILMGISMYVTQMLQPEPPDPMQAKIFKLMPIMFTFFFLWFPSGLVLYWLVNNLLSILQQWYVTRQLEKKT